MSFTKQYDTEAFNKYFNYDANDVYFYDIDMSHEIVEALYDLDRDGFILSEDHYNHIHDNLLKNIELIFNVLVFGKEALKDVEDFLLSCQLSYFNFENMSAAFYDMLIELVLDFYPDETKESYDNNDDNDFNDSLSEAITFAASELHNRALHCIITNFLECIGFNFNDLSYIDPTHDNYLKQSFNLAFENKNYNYTDFLQNKLIDSYLNTIETKGLLNYFNNNDNNKALIKVLKRNLKDNDYKSIPTLIEFKNNLVLNHLARSLTDSHY